MIILTTSTTAQQLSVIPRNYESNFTLDLRDDQTNVTVKYDILGAVTSGNYLNFDNVFSPVLVENHFYDLYLYIDYNFWNTNNSFWNLYDVLWQVDSDFKEDIFRIKYFARIKTLTN